MRAHTQRGDCERDDEGGGGGGRKRREKEEGRRESLRSRTVYVVRFHLSRYKPGTIAIRDHFRKDRKAKKAQKAKKQF